MQLYQKALELIDAGQPFALAVVIRSSGSTPQKAGAAAIFEPNGAVWGTLGGGCLEAESRARALQALDTRQPLVFELSLDEDYGWDDGLICGGRVRIFIETDAARHREAFAAMLQAVDRRERGGLLWTIATTDSRDPARWLPEHELAEMGERHDAFSQSLNTEKPSHLLEGDTELYFEPVVPAPRLVIAGGGHVGQAVARLADFLGFEVTVIDDRPAFTKPDLYPAGVRAVCGDIPAAVADFPVAADTYYVIVTRGHRHDGEVLAACIRKPAAYIGMIGSRRKILLIRKQFLQEGAATEEELDRVYSPMGLDIGSVTVPEIATSICAELVAVRRKCEHVGRHLAEAVPR